MHSGAGLLVTSSQSKARAYARCLVLGVCVCVYLMCVAAVFLSSSPLSPWMGTNYLLERECIEAGRGQGNECHQPGEGWLLSSVLQVCLHQRSLNFLSVLPKGSAEWIRESPEEISSSKGEDVSRFLLFSSVVATEGAGMSILVPVVMEAKDGAWSLALIISRTTGLK